jgi:hypothetical protein
MKMTAGFTLPRPMGMVLFVLSGLFLFAPRALAQVDTVVVYENTFTKTGNGSALFEDDLPLTIVPGRRYALQLTNGGHVVTSARVSVGGQEWVGSTEFGSTSGTITRLIDVQTDNFVQVITTGTSGASVTLRVYHEPDSTFKVYGRTDFAYDTTTVSGSRHVDSFVAPVGGGPVFDLRVINGGPAGANRVVSGSLSLNGVTVLQSSDFGAGVATLRRTVTLSGAGTPNLVSTSFATTGSKITVWFTAHDTLPPALTLSAPTESLITMQGSVTVSGNVRDSTYVKLTVNGTVVTPAANGDFSTNVTLAADMIYTIPIIATDAAGHITSMTRHVTRDTRSSTLVITRPTDGAVVTATADTFTVAGYFADSTRTTVTIDGDTILISSGANVGLTRLYHLDIGQNKIAARAIDAVGHVTEVAVHAFRQTGTETPADSTLTGSTATVTGVRLFRESIQFLYT